MQKGYCMKSSFDVFNKYDNEIKRFEKKYSQLSKYVMESKQFERKMFYAVAGLYLFIICHIIGFVIGKVF